MDKKLLFDLINFLECVQLNYLSSQNKLDRRLKEKLGSCHFNVYDFLDDYTKIYNEMNECLNLITYLKGIQKEETDER